jgi:penicillin-binding protein 1C
MLKSGSVMKKRLLFLLVILSLAWGGFEVYLLQPPSNFSPPCSTQAVDRQGRLLRLFTTTDGFWRLPAHLDRIDPQFIRLLLACEDKRFWSHYGVDLLALSRALLQLIEHGRIISGASTITMQTVRLLHPRPRTLRSKVIEMAQALRLERHLSKRQILATYLTLAPYGGNLEGLEAACRFYFHKDATRLTPSEAALLISLPQSPERRRPDRHPKQAEAARNRVLARLLEHGQLSAEQAQLARKQPVPQHRQPAPFLAPQLTGRLHGLYPQQELLHTTLALPLQEKMEGLAAQAQQRFNSRKQTLALLVLENQSRQVLAHIGSGGWRISNLDLTKARRSPGSALKPFIYGLAFEQGILHPETLILDQPKRFGSYGPDNFDRRHHGWIPAREALRRSLNLPAVQVLERIGPQRLLARFAKLGIIMGSRLQTEQPGLSIALGGTATTLRDLTALYAALADQGRYRPLTFNPAARPGPVLRLLAPAAAWQIDRILGAMSQSNGRIRYKTGTSYGFRDAWAVGYTKQHTVGVWVGRPDGGYGKRQTGAELAVPILLQVFAALPQQPEEPERVPAGVRRLAHSQLPPHLQYFSQSLRPGQPSRPHIYFPVNGSTVQLGSQPRLALKAHGGAPPFHWLINGQPLSAEQQTARASCTAPGAGLTEIVLVDSSGQQDKISIWIEMENNVQQRQNLLEKQAR